MANMGAQKLIIVDTKCEYDLAARQGAAGAQSHIVQATHYTSMDQFLSSEPDGYRIAFCARTKKETDDLSLEERAQQITLKQRDSKLPIYLLFGPEDHGLENDDLDYAHFICSLPTFGEFKSLNLSHAVMLALYNFRRLEPQAKPAQVADTIQEPFYFPKLAINEWLSTLGFETGDRRTDAYKVLKRILLNNHVTAKEARILEAIVNQTVRKLGGRPSD
jgi:tRNA/rRNA methyltransferase